MAAQQPRGQNGCRVVQALSPPGSGVTVLEGIPPVNRARTTVAVSVMMSLTLLVGCGDGTSSDDGSDDGDNGQVEDGTGSDDDGSDDGDDGDDEADED